MSDESLFDEIARALASPMSRRRAFRRILGGLAGAALATVAAPGRALAAPKSCQTNTDCGSGFFCCNATICCSTGQICCGSGANSKCCPQGGTCCGSGASVICCSAGQICSGHGANVTCLSASPSR